MKTREDLKTEGWSEITVFGGYVVFGRGKERILRNPETSKVHLSYTSK